MKGDSSEEGRKKMEEEIEKDDPHVLTIEIQIEDEEIHRLSISLYEKDPTVFIRIKPYDNGVFNGSMEIRTGDKDWTDDFLFANVIFKSPLNRSIHEKVAAIVNISMNHLSRFSDIKEEHLRLFHSRLRDSLMKYFFKMRVKEIPKPDTVDIDDYWNPYDSIETEKPSHIRAPIRRVFSDEEASHISEYYDVKVVFEVYDAESTVKRYETKVPYRDYHDLPVLKLNIKSIVNEKIQGAIEVKTSSDISYEEIYTFNRDKTVLKQIRTVLTKTFKAIERHHPNMKEDAEECYLHITGEMKNINKKIHGTRWR